MPNKTNTCPECGRQKTAESSRCRICYLAGRGGGIRFPIEPPNPSGFCGCGCGRPTPIAKATRANRGWLRGHPIPFILGHQVRRVARSIFTWYRVDPGAGCWNWDGTVEENGYGRFGANASRKGAHVLFYEHFVGPVPKGLVIHHICGNRQCVNPKHLKPATHAENARAGRGTKLTIEDVRVIRSLQGKKTYRQISQQFGISKKYVANIMYRETWKDV